MLKHTQAVILAGGEAVGTAKRDRANPPCRSEARIASSISHSRIASTAACTGSWC